MQKSRLCLDVIGQVSMRLRDRLTVMGMLVIMAIILLG